MRHRRWKSVLLTLIIAVGLADLAALSACRRVQLETAALSAPPPLPKSASTGTPRSALLALSTLQIGPLPQIEEVPPAEPARDLIAEMREDYVLVSPPWSYGDAPDSRLAMVMHLPTGQQSILRPASATSDANRHEGTLLTREGAEIEVIEITRDGVRFAVPDAGTPGILLHDPELLASLDEARMKASLPVAPPSRRR